MTDRISRPIPAALIDQTLRERFGLASFRPGQRAVIDALLTRGGALAVFPTGAGKSLCYQLPALLLDGLTLVVSPLLALMKDQIDALARLGIPAARLDSSLTLAQTQETTQAIRRGETKLLYVAPERFNNERFLSLLQGVRISLFAVDEAHCISEWGHNFRPDYLKLAEAAQRLKVERVLALTATATPSVVDDICRGFGIARECAVVTGFHRPNLALETTAVDASERDGVLLERLRAREPGPTIVYVTLQKTAERLATWLSSHGLAARAYHAGMETDARVAVQEEWMASDRRIVVATIAFGMGIDKSNVRYVYHYNLPKGLESYSQEIGRAGRDGLPSTVELLACADDVPTLENFAHGDTPTESSIRALLTELLSLGPVFDVALTDLSSRHDVRPLVLRTALTYLEIEGVLRQGTPSYGGYELRPLIALEALFAKFDPDRGDFVRRVLAEAKKGRIWYALDPGRVADRLREPRDRVVRALEYLEEKAWIELRASDVRHHFTRVAADPSLDALVALLTVRFARRETTEVARLQDVLALVEWAGCQANKLVSHFGEVRDAPCGRCTFCRTGKPTRLHAAAPPRSITESLDLGALTQLGAKHADALGHPRQVARFLCGLASPALSRARLQKHETFGALESRRFADVLRFCEARGG